MVYFIKNGEKGWKHQVATDGVRGKRICIQFGKKEQKSNRKISKL